VPLADAEIAVVLVHGRGARAEEMLAFAQAFPADGASLLAPQAVGSQWYPHSFLVPLEDNEPWLSSALNLLGRVLESVERDGPGRARTVLVGFSQGACLMLEFVARQPARYGGVAGLSGGLIGPPGTPRNYEGSLEQTPVFLGCSDVDPHIPAGRVEETASVLGAMGAEVTTRIYAGMGHTVNDDEVTEVRRLVEGARQSG
jgi:predicted esterase